MTQAAGIACEYFIHYGRTVHHGVHPIDWLRLRWMIARSDTFRIVHAADVLNQTSILLVAI